MPAVAAEQLTLEVKLWVVLRIAMPSCTRSSGKRAVRCSISMSSFRRDLDYNSRMQSTFNDRGEILAKSVPVGVAPIDDEDLGHVVLLIPCETENECESTISSVSNPIVTSRTTRIMPGKTLAQPPQTAKEAVVVWHSKLARPYRFAPAE
jgi:hypothetical protein